MKKFISDLWAELRRIAGERKGAASKAREAVQDGKQSPHRPEKRVSDTP